MLKLTQKASNKALAATVKRKQGDCLHRWLIDTWPELDGWHKARCMKCTATTRFMGKAAMEKKCGKNPSVQRHVVGREEIKDFLCANRRHTM